MGCARWSTWSRRSAVPSAPCLAGSRRQAGWTRPWRCAFRSMRACATPKRAGRRRGIGRACWRWARSSPACRLWRRPTRRRSRLRPRLPAPAAAGRPRPDRRRGGARHPGTRRRRPRRWRCSRRGVAPPRTFTVTTAADVVDPGDGQLSLREAVAAANATPALDAIRFAPSLEGQTLVLTGGQLTVSQDLIIDGNGDDGGARDHRRQRTRAACWRSPAAAPMSLCAISRSPAAQLETTAAGFGLAAGSSCS